MAIFWPKKWSQGPEKKKKKFFSFFYLWNPKTKKTPLLFFWFSFFLPIFCGKMSVFSRFFGQKSPLGPFHEYPPGPTGVPYRFKPKKWSKMDFLFLCPHSTHSGYFQKTYLMDYISWASNVVCICANCQNFLLSGCLLHVELILFWVTTNTI